MYIADIHLGQDRAGHVAHRRRHITNTATRFDSRRDIAFGGGHRRDIPPRQDCAADVLERLHRVNVLCGSQCGRHAAVVDGHRADRSGSRRHTSRKIATIDSADLDLADVTPGRECTGHTSIELYRPDGAHLRFNDQ